MRWKDSKMRKALAVAVALAGVALAGCASDTVSNRQGPVGTTTGPSIGGPASSAPVASSPPSAKAPSTAALIAACPTELDAAQANGPTAQTLPATIDVDSVLQCSISQKTPGSRTLTIARSSGDTTALLTALRAKSALKIKGVCPMYRQAVPYFALVQSDGKTLAPKVPVTNCGQPQPDVLAALAKLKFTVIATKPVD